MATRFLYIDDEPAKAEGIIKPICDPDLEIIVESPKTWSEEKIYLIDNQELNKYDGLLLDLKLEFTENGSEETKYKGSDLAQSIRTDVKANKIQDLPIFLCSTQGRIIEFLDRTGYDLFDKKYDKDFFSKDPQRIKNQFIAFADAYKTIIATPNVQALLLKSIGENEELVALESELKKYKTPHEIMYLLHNYVIKSNGILLDETLLAIRLGINYKTSGDWEKLKKEIMSEFIYKGILNGCYERWWQKDILDWWKKEFAKSLKVMSAELKVSVIKEKFNLSDLNALELPRNQRFDTFWYKCRLSNFPLEPSDALRTLEMPRYVWQEPSYISMGYLTSEERDREVVKALLGANEQKIFAELISKEK